MLQWQIGIKNTTEHKLREIQLTNFVRLGSEWPLYELHKGRIFSYEANFHKYKHRSSIWTGEAWKYANFQGSEFGCCYLSCYRTYKGRFCGLQD